MAKLDMHKKYIIHKIKTRKTENNKYK